MVQKKKAAKGFLPSLRSVAYVRRFRITRYATASSPAIAKTPSKPGSSPFFLGTFGAAPASPAAGVVPGFAVPVGFAVFTAVAAVVAAVAVAVGVAVDVTVGVAVAGGYVPPLPPPPLLRRRWDVVVVL